MAGVPAILTGAQWVRWVEKRLASLERRVGSLGGGSGAGLATGVIAPFAGSVAPTNSLLCDGAAVSRTTYATLFALIGTTYGAGNGTTTFNVPNAKGRNLVGRDAAQTEFDVLGETGGAKTVTLDVTQIPAHTHVQNAHTHIQNSHTHQTGITSSAMTATAGPNSAFVTITQDQLPTSATTAVNQNATAVNQNAGGGLAHNNLAPYLVINYIIGI